MSGYKVCNQNPDYYHYTVKPRVLGEGNIRGKSGFALVYNMHIKPYLGEEIGRGKSGFAVNRGTVNRGLR